MVDLQHQYEEIKEAINEGFEEVLSSAMFINGPQVKNFQAELETYLGVRSM